MLNVRRRRVGSGWVLELQGVIDGTTTPEQLGRDDEGVVVLDVRGVRAVTSIGVRTWITSVSNMRATALYYVNCPPPLMLGFNTLQGFAGRGAIVSALVPYTCANGHLFERRADLRLASFDATESPPCPTCGGASNLDEEPDYYFSYARAQGPPRVGSDADQILSQLDTGK